MVETFKFAKCYPGGTTFAQVEVEFVRREKNGGVRVTINVATPIDYGAGEFSPEEFPHLFSAALEGMEAVATRAAGKAISGDLRFRRLVGLVTDTHPDGVECAAAVAAARLVLPPQGHPTISDDQPWHLIWPDDAT